MEAAPKNKLLGSFNQTQEALYREFQDYGKPMAQRRKKTFERILNAVSRFSRKQPKEQQSTGDLRVQNPPEVVRLLSEILDFKEKQVGFRGISLFYEAIESWPSDTPNIRDESQIKDSEFPKYAVVYALCLIDGSVAFENIDKSKGSPFEVAAKKGATELVHLMLRELRNSLNEQDYQTEDEKRSYALTKISSPPQSQDSKSAFLLAVEKPMIGVLDLLLDDYPELASWEALKAIIWRTSLNEATEVQDAALRAFERVLGCMDKAKDDELRSKVWQEAVEASSGKVVSYLLDETKSHMNKPFIADSDVIFLMKYGGKHLWGKFSQEERESLIGKTNKKGSLLHAAVEAYNADIVSEIIREFPEQIESQFEEGSGESKKSLYPIQYLQQPSQSDSSKAYKQIRDTLLHAMIRSSSENLGIRQIRTILKDANGIVLPAQQRPINVSDRPS